MLPVHPVSLCAKGRGVQVSAEFEMFAANIHATKADAQTAYDKLFAGISAMIRSAGMPGAVVAVSAMYREEGQTKVLVNMDGCGSQDFVDQIMDRALGKGAAT